MTGDLIVLGRGWNDEHQQDLDRLRDEVRVTQVTLGFKAPAYWQVAPSALVQS